MSLQHHTYEKTNEDLVGDSLSLRR
jgi:hypothetical protein